MHCFCPLRYRPSVTHIIDILCPARNIRGICGVGGVNFARASENTFLRIDVHVLTKVRKCECRSDKGKIVDRKNSKASVVMQRLSYPTETVLSNEISRNRIVLSHSKTVLENHYDGDIMSNCALLRRVQVRIPHTSVNICIVSLARGN